MQVWPKCLAFMLLPALACAGPWPREKGATFVSVSYSLATPLDAPGDDLQHYGSVYLEHGIGWRLTFGLDAGMDPGANYSAILFLRRPVDLGSETSLFAVQAGVGHASASAFATGRGEYLLQAGASWGRGLETRFGGGWATLDGSVIYNLAQDNIAAKADLTLGVKPDDRTKLILQLQIGDYPDADPYVRLAPSVARKFGERTHVEVGAQYGVAGDDRVGLKLGTWLDF